MITPADELVRVPFERLFSKSVFRHVQLLLMGAVLAPGKRTVRAVLGILGLKEGKAFSQVSPGVELGGVVSPGSGADSAQVAIDLLSAGRAGGSRH
jgi:hypothetical protein